MNHDLNIKMNEIRALMDKKGFSSDISSFWEKLTLVHSELSESADAYRKGKSYGEVCEELMDAIIRILHLISIFDQDPEKLYRIKMDNNQKRKNRWNTVRGA